jgi:hypothetical protein
MLIECDNLLSLLMTGPLSKLSVNSLKLLPLNKIPLSKLGIGKFKALDYFQKLERIWPQQHGAEVVSSKTKLERRLLLRLWAECRSGQ